MMQKKTDILYKLFKQLKVRYTNFYLNKLYEEHPHKDNLFGLSRILKDYNIENEGYKFEDKDILEELDVPFVAQYNYRLVVVLRLTKTHVYYYFDGKELSVTISEFKKGWSGVVLIIGDHPNAIEPEYKNNRLKEYYYRILNFTLTLSIFIIPLLLIASNGEYYNKAGIIILMALNFIGSYIGFLLILKQIKIHSASADKICSVFKKKGDCNNVLESKAAKLWGIIGWSEAGFSYFLSNLIIIFLFPNLLPYLALINLCALPYSIWSIWYQKAKIKQWCTLCLIVQLLFYSIFANNLFFGYIQIPEFNWINLSIIVLVYMLPFCLISILLPVIAKSRQISGLKHAFNNLKMTNEVIHGLLYTKDKYDTDHVSTIIFGNPEAKNRLTIVSNPYCEPCGIIHEKIDRLFNHMEENDISLQFLFINFDNEMVKDGGKFLIAAYQNNDQETARQIYYKWFTDEKYAIDKTYTQYGFDMIAEKVVKEQLKHEKWSKQNNIHHTPTTLLNGYILPDIYDINDISLLIS